MFIPSPLFDGRQRCISIHCARSILLVWVKICHIETVSETVWVADLGLVFGIFVYPRFTVLESVFTDMPRSPTVTADGTVEAIRSSETPFASTGDLADYFDVTRQAVRERRELLNGDPRIKVGKIGNSTVIYLADDDPIDSKVEMPPGEEFEFDEEETGDVSDADNEKQPENNSSGGLFTGLFTKETQSKSLPGVAIFVVFMGIFGFFAITTLLAALETFGDDRLIEDGQLQLSIESGAAVVLTGTLFFASATVVAYYLAAPALTAAFALNALWGVFTLLAIPIVTRVLAYVSVVVSTKSVAFIRGAQT